MNSNEGARLQTCLKTRAGQAMSLLGVKLSGELHGLMFEASVEQRFCNPSDRNLEVVYSFPLPWGAVLLGVDVRLGERHLVGAVTEKVEAEDRYEQALSEGDAAILLQKNRDHSYSLSLGNLAAQEQCLIRLRYAQVLQFEQGGLRLLIPTVLAPRYGDPVRDGGLRPHEVPSHSLVAEYPFELELRLHGELAQARVASPSHPVSVAHQATDAGPVLSLSLACKAFLDRDFVLVVDRLASQSLAVLARDDPSPGRVAVLASFCPRIAAPVSLGVTVKLLVDCSGSMAGDSIDAAKRALQAIVRQLAAGDRFSLSRFGDSVEHRSRGLWKATATTEGAARRWVDALQADLGGTEMEAALTSTFAIDAGAGSDVLLVTDGEISAIDSTIAAAVASGQRVFVVGIGSSPAESHLRRLADATGGACDFVAPGEAVEPAVLRMFARLRSPRLADLRLEWPEGVAPEWVAPLRPSVFDGDTVNVLAFLRQLPVGELRLLGRQQAVVAHQALGSALLPTVAQGADTLPRLVAAAQVQALDPFAESKEATRLAVDYQLVTQHTHFLLIHQREEAEKAADMPDLHTVAQMLAAGWGGTGSARFSRRRVEESGAPSVFRMSSAAPVMFCAMDMDAPAFLRRQDDQDDGDVPAFLRRSKPKIDLDDPRHWMDTAHYAGLTPLGLSEWLCQTPMADWPGSYAELGQIGLGRWLLDWLELAIAAQGRYMEQQVVQAFLHIMASTGMRDALARSEGLVAVVKGAAQRLRGLVSGTAADTPSGVDQALVEALAVELQGITARAWPDAVFLLERADRADQDDAEAALV